jgi:CubicO group peptidase (beta-lactamase class C family)
MKGVTSYFQAGQVDVKAILAGNDVLLYTENVPKAVEEIKKAIENNQLTSDELNYHVKKILLAKYWMGLNNYKPIVTEHLYEDLNTPAAKLLNQQLFEESATLLNNKNNLLPLKNLETKKIASVVINDSVGVSFNKMLENYAPINTFQLKKDANPNTVDSLVKELLPSYNTVIVSIHNTSINAAKNYGITAAMNSFIEDLQGKCKLIVVVFGNPYVLSKLPAAAKVDALLMSYEGAEESQKVAAQNIFGGMSTAGKLPVTANASFKILAGSSTPEPIRFKYTYPEETGIASSDLSPIDSIVQKAIKAGATPGCQVLVAKDGKVIYNKAFGYHTYDNLKPVKTTDIYDIASITKVAATTMSLMQLYDKGQLNLDAKLVKYLPDVKKTNKKNIILRDMLAHQARLLSYIKFWQTTMTNDGNWSAAYYRNKPEKGFSMQVADSLYIRNDYADSIWARIKKSPLGDTKKYVYSDLGFITAKRIVEKLTHESIDKYTFEHLYQPLGLATMGYLPLNRFDKKRIIPTENDTKFRKQLVWGYVHDPATAMMGGISGHAGVFSDANDLAVLMQMLLNGGEYGGKRYLKQSTITTFTSQQFPKDGNRRALGFDKPEPDSTKSSPTCKGVSLLAFGHQGFTGTCVWVDPKYNLIYVFLSNRVNPDAENDKLVKMNVRTNIQKTIYEALKKAAQ